jgi:hypothetical protein
MSEINIDKGVFNELSFRHLDASTIEYLKSILVPGRLAVPEGFELKERFAKWKPVTCDHFELRLTGK